MLTPDDPRHGRAHTYTRHACRCERCSAAKARADKVRNVKMARGIPRKVDRAPSVRKIQALCALGWSMQMLAEELGRSTNYLTKFVSDTAGLMPAGAREIDQLYRKLQGRPGPSNSARIRAAKKGWLPPLAWEDIEAGTLPVVPGEEGFDTKRFDEDLIEYVMQYHDFNVRLSPLEKSEVVRRWTANGRTEHSLCALTGWREGRYRSPRPQEAS